jgi:quinol monooxygenase YgiN
MVKPVVLHVNWIVKPGNDAAFIEAAKTLIEHITKEPECLYIDLLHDIREPNKYKFIEVWNTEASWIPEV